MEKKRSMTRTSGPKGLRKVYQIVLISLFRFAFWLVPVFFAILMVHLMQIYLLVFESAMFEICIYLISARFF